LALAVKRRVDPLFWTAYAFGIAGLKSHGFCNRGFVGLSPDYSNEFVAQWDHCRVIRFMTKKGIAMFQCKKCSRWVSAGLVCACLFQGVSAPSVGVISWITSPASVVMASSTSSLTSTIALDALSGKTYDVAPERKTLHGEPDDQKTLGSLTNQDGKTALP